MNNSHHLTGCVMRLDARGCLVQLESLSPEGAGEAAPTETIWCSVRGKVHLDGRPGERTPLAVGDRVRVDRVASDRGAIEAVLPRRSSLSRPSGRRGRPDHVLAANVDAVAIVSSVADPAFNAGLVDRILVMVEYSNLDALVVINKIDLAVEPLAQPDLYRGLGYAVYLTSAREGIGLEDLRAAFTGRETVITGHSGVGKSSLLNALVPDLDLRVQAVNAVTRRGTHATTAAIRIPLEGGGAVVDTAGVREFSLTDVEAQNLPWLFRDLAKFAPDCRFPNCIHLQEPDCAVRRAVEAGQVAASRFASYQRILASLSV